MMGLVNFKKKSWKFISGIGIIAGILTWLGIDFSSFKNTFLFLGRFLINSTVRDIILFLLIIGILVWTVFINKKTKKPVSKEIGELKATANNMIRYNNKLRETANRIIKRNEELQRIADKAMAENKKINDQMEKKISETRKEMKRDLEKHLEAIKTKTQQKKEVPKPNNEIIFILNILANQHDRTLEQAILEDIYKSKFRERKESDFQIVLNELDIADLIYETECGDYGEICWVITREGLSYLNQYKTK